MHDLILEWADDAYVLGSQLASITGLYGPQLEENLALGSLAQDSLGHARLLYLRLAEDDAGVDRLVFSRDAADYRASLLAGEWRDFDWAFVCVRGLAYALADMIRCSAVATDPANPLHDLATTIARDTSVHVEHWTEWLRALARNNATDLPEAALVSIWPLMGEFFSETVWQAAAPAMLEQWVHDMRVSAASIGIAVPASDAAALLEAASDLRKRGLEGRAGRPGPAVQALISEANSVYRAHPGVTLA